MTWTVQLVQEKGKLSEVFVMGNDKQTARLEARTGQAGGDGGGSVLASYD